MSKINSVDDYLKILMQDQDNGVIQEFINTVTTNTTEFFREREHFDFIQKNILTILKENPDIQRDREIRVWCAASSTGQEPVTIAILLRECLGDNIRIRILATDINSEVLKKAVRGVYSAEECKSVPKLYLGKYFEQLSKDSFRVHSTILDMISYRQFNLMNDFIFKRKFNIIFCRNVMIYFNLATQQVLIKKFYDSLNVGGYFFAGKSESLGNKRHEFRSKGPSIYIK